MSDEKLLLGVDDVATRLGISRTTLWRRIPEWGLTVYADPLDKRLTLLDWAEVERAVRRRPRDASGAGQKG